MTRVHQLIDELHELGKVREDALQISREEGEFLHHVALISHARVIVEVGTSYGFSGLFWARALLHTGGVLHTIDADPAKVASAKQTFTDAGLGEIVTTHFGKAADVLATLHGPIDVAFIDADKPSTRTYFDLIWPKLRPGGSILTDNTITHRGELGEFIQFVRSIENASSMEVAVGNGVEWTVKLTKK